MLTRTAIAVVVFAAATGSAEPHAFADRFLDDSGRTAPRVIAVPALAFTMGSAPDDPGYRTGAAQHVVRVGSYAIGESEITTAEFCEFLNERGNAMSLGIRWALTESRASLIRQRDGHFAPIEGAGDRPVVAISWQAAREYCRWLSEETGHAYDLPTAAEWEAAARAGTRTTWWWGGEDDPVRYRSHEDLRLDASTPVRSYPANPWGLYDTAGNVWEWTLDCHESDFYRFAPSEDPVNLDEACLTPEVRGGSFKSGGDFAAPGYRASVWWWGEYDEIGFRIARHAHVGSER